MGGGEAAPNEGDVRGRVPRNTGELKKYLNKIRIYTRETYGSQEIQIYKRTAVFKRKVHFWNDSCKNVAGGR